MTGEEGEGKGDSVKGYGARVEEAGIIYWESSWKVGLGTGTRIAAAPTATRPATLTSAPKAKWGDEGIRLVVLEGLRGR